MNHLALPLKGRGWTPKSASENKTSWREEKEKALEAHPGEEFDYNPYRPNPLWDGNYQG